MCANYCIPAHLDQDKVEVVSDVELRDDHVEAVADEEDEGHDDNEGGGGDWSHLTVNTRSSGSVVSGQVMRVTPSQDWGHHQQHDWT